MPKGGGNSLSQSQILSTLNFFRERTEQHVVGSGKTSTGWWRKWSDGLIEQGGFKRVGKNSLMQTNVVFQYPYSSSDSYMVISSLRTGALDANPRNLTQSFNKSSTGFSFFCNTASEGYVEWQATGY